MYKRGKDEDDGLDSLRSDFGSEEELGDERGFLDDVAPAEDDAEDKPREQRSSGVPGNVSFIGGIFRVIGIALVSVLIFLLIGVGITFGLSAAGIVEIIDFSRASVPVISLLPTSVPPTDAPVSVPTQPPPTEVAAAAAPTTDTAGGQPVPVPTATPENVTVIPPTPVTACAEMADWWEDQSAIYATFAALSVEQPPQTLLATLQQMRVRRDAAQAAVLVPCIDPVRTAFVNGYDLQIRAFEAVNNSDLPGARSLMLMAGEAYAQAHAGLWRAGIATDGSPLASGIGADSGTSCGASAWYQAAKTQRDTLLDAYLAVNPETMPPPQIRQNQDTMAAAASNVATLQTPACASTPSNLLINYMQDLINALQMQLGSNPAEIERLISAYNNRLLLNAWLYYLGLVP
jgi:hypothetical protein